MSYTDQLLNRSNDIIWVQEFQGHHCSSERSTEISEVIKKQHFYKPILKFIIYLVIILAICVQEKYLIIITHLPEED